MKPLLRIIFLFVLFPVCSAYSLSIRMDRILESPYATITTHLRFLAGQGPLYSPTTAAMAFSPKERTEKEAMELAVQLKEHLATVGFDMATLDFTKLPKNPNYIDPQAKQHKYLLTQALPQVYLVRVNQKWIYSEETVRYLKQLSATRWRFNRDGLKHLFPKSNPQKRWLLGSGLVLLGCLLGWLLYQLVKASTKKLVSYLPLPHSEIITKPFLLFVLAAFLVIKPLIEGIISLPPLVSLLLSAAPTFLISLTLYQSVNGIATYLCSTLAGQRGRRHTQLAALMGSILKVLILIAGTLLTLRNLNFDITPLLASVSIGGIGFALASQDLFKNIFGSLVIFMDQPFRVGDTIAAKDIEGKVEEIGLRSTRLVTTHNSITYVPNAQLANSYIDNYGYKKYYPFKSHIEVAYNTPADLMTALIEGLKKIVTDTPYIRKDEHVIYLKAAHHTKLQLLFYVHLEASVRAQELQYQEEIQRNIYQLATQIGIDISLLD